MDSESLRVEKDSLGTLYVPANALYGAQTQRAVENFPISGLRPWRAFIWSMATIKRAAAEVNHDLGLLDDERAKAIIKAAQEVIDGKWDDQFVVDPFQAGAGTSHNMNVNEVIANRATLVLGGRLGEYHVHPNDHVNMAQSTNDTIPTAIRLGCLWRLDELLEALDDLGTALGAQAGEFDGVVRWGWGWGRRSAGMRKRYGATASVPRARRRGCGGSASAGRRPEPASTRIPNITPAWSRASPSLPA